MGHSTQRRDAERLLAGLENGGLTAADAATLAESLDPVLVHFVIRYLRECYPASDRAATSVLDRVVRLTRAAPDLVRQAKVGEQDPIAQWVSQAFVLREWKGRGAELIDRIVEKLES